MPRLRFLDSLRGLAAVYVVLFHTALVPAPPPVVPDVAGPLVLFGQTGVYLFFVISGFSLSLTMPRHTARESPLESYALSRIFRIAPLFYFLLAVSVWRDWAQFGTRQSPANIILNASFLFNFVPRHQEGIVWASWTIGVEMVYYAIFPLVFCLSVLKKAVLAGVLFGAFWAMEQVSAAAPILKFSCVGYIPLFLLGEIAFAAFTLLKDAPLAQRYGQALVAGGTLLLAICILAVRREDLILWRSLVSTGYACLLVGLGLAPLKLIINPATGFLGKISYSTYLCHAPIVYTLAPVYSLVSSLLPRDLGYLACVVLTLATALPVAYLCFILIEQPGISLGSKLLNRRRWQATPA